MDLEIRQAKPEEFERVRAFYHTVIDGMEDSEYEIGWKKDIYPDSDDLRDALQKDELYIGELSGEIVTAMILNHDYNESYDDFEWPTDAFGDEVSVIHALGVLPA